MMFLFRPSHAHLALGAGNEDGTETMYRLPGETKVAIADVPFMTKLHATGIYDLMVAENPERMARVELHGVGILTRDKPMITNFGLTRAALALANAPGVPEFVVPAGGRGR